MKRLTFVVASAALVALTAALVVPMAAFAEGTESVGSEAAAATEAPASTKDTYQLKVSGMT